ncbi:MAG: methyltransferase [Clostridia bacterium]|nr:methyltransferase [Clostridia bacterium]
MCFRQNSILILLTFRATVGILKKEVFSVSEVIEDMGIDGLKIVQDTELYRFTSDSVLLSRFARAKNGDKVADFCSGSGIVAFHFHALNRDKKGLSYTLFELQEPLCALSKKTAALNGFDNFEFCNGRLQDIPESYREQFSLVLCNPPYERGGFENDDYSKAICRKELTITLLEIAKAAAFALKFGGRLALINRADRLAELCYVLKEYNIEVKRVQFVAGKEGAKPYLVMVEAVKGGKPACEILPTIIN